MWHLHPTAEERGEVYRTPPPAAPGFSPSVLHCLLQLVYRSCSEINLERACKRLLPSSGQPGERLSSSWGGKGGGGYIQMSNYPCSAVHETATQLETSYFHILFTRSLGAKGVRSALENQGLELFRRAKQGMSQRQERGGRRRRKKKTKKCESTRQSSVTRG